MKQIIAVVLALGVGNGLAMAQSQTTSPQTNKEGTPQTRAATSDPQFVMVAAQSGMAEVALGQLAQQQATNTEVKQFAARMVADHTKANDALKQVASAAQITLPDQPDAAHNAMKQQLSQVKGADFDREYMDAMVQDHQTAVALFEGEATNGTTDAIKNFAKKNLPPLTEHLDMAKRIAKAVGSKGAQK